MVDDVKVTETTWLFSEELGITSMGEEKSRVRVSSLYSRESPTPCHPLFLGDDPASNVAVAPEIAFDNIVRENSISLSLSRLFILNRSTHVANLR